MKKKGMLGRAVVAVLAIVLVLSLVIGCAAPAPAPAPEQKPTIVTPTPLPQPQPTVAPQKPAPIKLKTQSWGGASYTPRIMMEGVLNHLKASGYFEIEYFPQEGLMKSADAWDGMRQGVLDMAMSPAGYQVSRMGIAGETQWMPRNFDYDKFVEHYRDPGGLLDFYQPYFEKQGLRLVSDQHTPPNQGSSKVPIRTLEDLKGKLARDPGSFTPWLKLLGTSPVAVPSSEVYEAFQRGIIEVFFSHSLSSYVSTKWYEVTKYVLIIDWSLGGLQLTMNNDVYNSFSPEAKAAFDKAVLVNEEWMFEQNRKDIVDLLGLIEGKGVEIIEISKSEMARMDDAIAPYYDDLTKKYGAEWDAFKKIQATLK